MSAVETPQAGAGDADVEHLDQFRLRARSYIRAHFRHVGRIEIAMRNVPDEVELADVAEDRRLQRLLWDGGFAGICVPKAYGGRGLTPAHQVALNEELAGYQYPRKLQSPTMSPCLGVLLDFGTEEQKLRHIPAMLTGDEIWMQFLSEPGGGSDTAGARTSAVRDGDEWLLSGSKIWTTGAWWSDWGLCLARTNWDAPKHRGLTVFILPITREGIEMHRIEMLDGNREFCQEFLTDVRVPDSDRVGEVNDGWTVGTRWMFHERMLYNSPYVTLPSGTTQGRVGGSVMWEIARDAGRLEDPIAQSLVGEAEMLEVVGKHLAVRIRDGIMSKGLSDQAAAIGKLLHCTSSARMGTIGMELAGSAGGAWTDDDGTVGGVGTQFLMRQTGSIGGGTVEMARNVIAERVLGMPRDPAIDRDIPFRDVPTGNSSPSR